jgi:hypothetical protein
VTAVIDGSSNTLLYGETCGGPLAGYQMQWAWVTAGSLPTRSGITTDQTLFAITRFSSRHTGLVQFCIADGGVRSVRPGGTTTINPPSSDWYILQSLAGKSDGATANFSALMN